MIAAVVVLVLLLSGSYLLSHGPYVWDGGLLLVLGLLTLTTLLVRRFFPRFGERLLRVTHPVPRRLRYARWMRGGALALSLAVGLMARARSMEADYTLQLALWLLALAVFVLSLWIVSFPLPRPQIRLSRERWALLSLLLAAFMVRAIGLGRIPANFGGDEGTQAVLGLQMVEGRLGNPFATGWYSVPTLSFFLYGLAMKVFGATIAGARALSVLIGTLTVLGTWLLGRELGGQRVGWVAGIVTAFFAYHVHYSRLASNQIADPLIATFTFYLVWRALRASRPRPGAWGAAGMVVGFGWYFYFGARWVTILLGMVLVWRALVEPGFFRRHRRGLLLLVIGALVVVLPLVLWYLKYPDSLAARYNAVSIFNSGWLGREVEITGKSRLALLLQQLGKSLTAFHLTPDPTFWYYPERPLLDFVWGTLMLVGVVAAALRWRWPGRGFALLWFFTTTLAAWVITENPPSSQRGQLLVPAVALLCAWGFEALRSLPGRRPSPHWWRIVLLALLLSGLVLNVGFYFFVYAPRKTYGNPTARVATMVGRYVQDHPGPSEPLYFLGAPRIYADFGTLAFLLRDRERVDVPPGQLPTDVTAPARFILVLERTAQLSTLQERYPGGEVTLLEDAAVQAILYDWPGP